MRRTRHALRHSFLTHAMKVGNEIRTVRALLWHRVVRTTMSYTHLLNREGAA